MLVVNLANIKNTNGLFYYGVDYIKALRNPPDRILVRPALLQALSDQCPNVRSIPCSAFRYLVELLRAVCSGKTIYTPSSHPLPFVSRQLVVLHDTYPFQGRLGRLKRWLFLVSAHSSSCLLAYINTADGLVFYRKHGFDGKRLVFAPNLFPKAMAGLKSQRPPAETRLIVGLVGTDSTKKNYGSLFSEIRASERADNVLFSVYGHPTEYFRGVQAEFPELDIQLIRSDAVAMLDFLAGVDVLVSVAENEGFGRPIACALQSGVPCFLIDNSVFREFFEGGAQYSTSIRTLITDLFESWSNSGLPRVSFDPPPTVIAAFTHVAEILDKITRA